MSEDNLSTPVLIDDVDAIVNMVTRRFVAVHGRLPRIGENIFDDETLIGMPSTECDPEAPA